MGRRRGAPWLLIRSPVARSSGTVETRFDLEKLHPGAVVLHIASEPVGRLAGAVIALHLPVIRDEVEHAQVAGHLQLCRETRTVVEAARLGVLGDGAVHSATRALRTKRTHRRGQHRNIDFGHSTAFRRDTMIMRLNQDGG